MVTEENVLAAISSKNGDILWRRLLETDASRGDVKFLHVNKDSRNVARQSSEGDPFGVITVSGNSPILFRGWDVNTGNLAWEWSIIPTSENSQHSQFFFKDNHIYHVLPVWNSHIEVTEYYATTGQQRTGTTSKITAGWITKEKCLLNSNYFACLVKDQLLVLDLLAEQNNVRTKVIESPANEVKSVHGQEGFIQVGRQVVALDDLRVVFENRNLANLFMESSLIKLIKDNKVVKITSEDQELSVLTEIPDTIDSNLQIMSAKCRPKKDNVNQLSCRFLLLTDDGAIVLAQQGKIKWIREEALTRISAVEFLDLTLSDAQGAIEEELNNKDGESFPKCFVNSFLNISVIEFESFTCVQQRKSIVRPVTFIVSFFV